MSDTVSELFSPRSPNKPLVDPLHTTHAVLPAPFGVGVLRFVRSSKQPTLVGTIGASLFIVMGSMSVATATVFPQDAWGSPPTLAGKGHKTLIGLVGLLSIFSMLLLGPWFIGAGVSRGFGSSTFITVAVVRLLAVFYAARI